MKHRGEKGDPGERQKKAAPEEAARWAMTDSNRRPSACKAEFYAFFVNFRFFKNDKRG